MKFVSMAVLSNEQKREWAQLLYVSQRLSQKEIAERTGVSERTITSWKEKFNWDNLRQSLLVTKQEVLRRLYNQIEALTTEIESRDAAYSNSKEADTLNKLAASIRTLETETSIAEILEVGMRFIDFVRAQDLEFAKQITGYYDAFIQTKLK